MLSRVTDLALEVRESFPKDDVEISGVEIEKRDIGVSGITMTVIDIKDKHGEKAMGKPVGKYITLEFSDREWEKNDEMGLEKVLKDIIEETVSKKIVEADKKTKPINIEIRTGENISKKVVKLDRKRKESYKKIMIAGLGNRYATPDMLGNKVIEYMDIVPERICAIAPGVLSQTGMETCDIIKNIVTNEKFDCIIVIDSLCSRHTERLCHTIQITDTGISPGAGVGNKRKKINENVMGIPVIAIGVPTVVSMATVAYDCIEETLLAQGFSQEETQIFLGQMSNDKYSGLFVTPKDIDEQIFFIGKAIANGINSALKEL